MADLALGARLEERSQPVGHAVARLAVGVGQGVAGNLLYDAQRFSARGDDGWPDGHPALFAALVLVTAFAPLIVVGGLGALRRATLAGWTLAATGLLAFLGWHDRARAITHDLDAAVNPTPSGAVFVAAAVIVFVAHTLIAAADQARRPVAPYARYVDLGWRHAAQLALGLAFVGAFWIVLVLGAALFTLVGVEAVRTLITAQTFAYPATTVAFAAAIHLTHVRSGLVQGLRALGLTLLAWLTPVMTLFVAAFLLTLPFIGLAPLWETSSATGLLLGAAAALLVLINAAYQDGEAEVPRVLRLSVRGAALLLGPLVALATVAVWLRVDQHGLTPERVWAVACVAIAGCYAAAYVAAALMRPWMTLIRGANIAMAVFVLAVLVGLFTPVADPARLSVADQLRRLRAERIDAEAFDFVFLGFDSARYGRAALARLAAEEDTPRQQAIAERAQGMLEFETRGAAMSAQRAGRTEPAPPPVAELRFEAAPEGAVLPESFLDFARTQNDGAMRVCWRRVCVATLRDLDGDGRAEVLADLSNSIYVYQERDGVWAQVAAIGQFCTSAEQALREGDIETRPPRFPDVVIDGYRYQVVETYSFCGQPGRMPEPEPSP